MDPFFFDENFNSEMYEAMLIEQIIPAIWNPFPNFDHVWFQRDGILGHFRLRIWRLLELSRTDILGGTIEYSPRSLDLTLIIEFFIFFFILKKSNL